LIVSILSVKDALKYYKLVLNILCDDVMWRDQILWLWHW